MEDWSKRKTRQRFYRSSEWQILRKWILSRHPLCEKCIDNDRITPATELHHKIDIKDDPSKRLDTNNLQPLCKKCHDDITLNADNENKFTPVKTKWSIEDQLQKLKKQ